ncbi:MAG: Crp/Fnr family transcriptional regulator [Myxococcaceae bacterium]
MTRPEWLSKCELFSGLSAEQTQRFAALGKDRSARAGETIFKLGADADSLYIVCAGHVDLAFPLLVMGETKDVRFQALEAGRAFAWSALVPPHRLTMSALAANACELAAFAREDVLRLFREEPAIGLTVMSNLAGVVGARLIETQALWAREVQRNVSATYRQGPPP